MMIENQIHIQASLQSVWEALTQSKYTVQYMYGCNIVSDLEVGSEILWQGAEDGIYYVKGTVIAYEPLHEFAYTVIDPNGPYEDIPENYLTVRYILSEDKSGGILLTVTQGDYSLVADGKKRYDDTMAQGGWDSVLQSIKKLLESP